MPDDVDGENKYGNVGADVDDAGDVEERAEIDASPRFSPFPDLASWSTFEDLDQRDGNVEEGIEVGEQLDEEEGSAFPTWGEKFRVE